MKLVSWTTLGVIAAMFAVAPAANAAEAKLRDCLEMDKRVTQAIEQAQPGQAVDSARLAATAGRTFCNQARFNLGVARYTKALQLLGKS